MINLKLKGHFENENYRIFHTTKEAKRNHADTSAWEKSIGQELVDKIKTAKTFEEVKKDIDSLVQRLEHSENYGFLDNYNHWAQMLLSLTDIFNPKYEEYVGKIVLVAPPGFQCVLSDKLNTILLKPNLDEKNFKKELLSNTYRLLYWENLEKKIGKQVDYHQLYHIWVRHIWKNQFGITLDKNNFDKSLLTEYEKSEQDLKKYSGDVSCL